MKTIKMIFFLVLLFLVPVLGQAQTASVPPVDNSAVFTTLARLQTIYLTYYDRLCLKAELDGMPVVVTSVQSDRFHFEAVVFRLDKKVTDMIGYHIKIDGDLAWINPVAASGARSQSAVLRNTELWNTPVFSSQFHIGDFLPALFLQLKFTSLTENQVGGNPRMYLTSLLTIGESKENREIILEIDKVSGVPKGFDVQNLNKKKLRSIAIQSYGNYLGKSYGKEAVVTDYETGQKSKVIVQQMSAFKPGISLTSLSTITPDNWQNFCDLNPTANPSKPAKDAPITPLKPVP